MRPETITSGWPAGKPFYCGKTVQTPASRLLGHRQKPSGNAGLHVLNCGQFVRLRVMEIVDAHTCWSTQERYWISVLRRLYPDCCLNLTDGGEGAPGWVPNAEYRAQLSAREQGKRRSPETRAKIGASKRGKLLSTEHRSKLAAAKRGKTLSLCAREKLRIANQGKKLSFETRAKMSTVAKNRAPEVYVKLSAALREKRTLRQSLKLTSPCECSALRAQPVHELFQP